jgi:4'-phosphopantetheinyl transferase
MPGRSRFELEGRTVHVWPVRTSASIDVVSSLEGVLDPQERQRAAQFLSHDARRTFIVGRAALRTLLGSYLKTSASGIEFKFGHKGKPSLEGLSLTFNVSHSGDLVVLAFTHGCEIGIDVERIRAIQDMQNIADRFFSSDEAAELKSVPADERDRAFFLCWTRKEAYIKAIGEGLSFPLNDFCVTVQAGDPVRFIHLGGDAAVAKEWMLHDLRLAPNYAAALAYRDAERPVKVLPLLEAAELSGYPR